MTNPASTPGDAYDGGKRDVGACHGGPGATAVGADVLLPASISDKMTGLLIPASQRSTRARQPNTVHRSHTHSRRRRQRYHRPVRSPPDRRAQHRGRSQTSPRRAGAVIDHINRKISIDPYRVWAGSPKKRPKTIVITL